LLAVGSHAPASTRTKAVELSEGDQDPTRRTGAGLRPYTQNSGCPEDRARILAKAKSNYVSNYLVVTIYFGLNDKDRAFEFLEKAYQERSWELPYFMKADLRIDNLRSDPRFRDIRRGIKLPQ
jgi:hypothetical protein